MLKNKTIYKEPANIFIAKYLGIPEINIVQAFLIRGKNSTYIKLTDNIKFKVSPKREKWLDGYDKKNIYFGIRAEDIIEIHNTSKLIDRSYYIAEKKDEIVINFKNYDILEIGGLEFTVEQKKKFEIGEQLKFSFNMDNCHIFDRKTKENVARDLDLLFINK
ncbi:MAG: hypothetical protein ACQERZ_09785 [Fusobacteriota bacterium]